MMIRLFQRIDLGPVTPEGAQHIHSVFHAAGVDIDVSGFRHQVDAFAARHGHIAPSGKTYDLVPTSCRRMSTPIWSDRIRAVQASVL
jgi:hypothetical protein